MMKLNEFRKYNFCITWKLIDIGFRGSDIFKNELQPNDILDYAVTRLENSDCDSLICQLASEYVDNIDEINKILRTLAIKEPSNKEIELKKWRVIFVARTINKKNCNIIDGLMELGDLWIKFGFPEDSPHTFQGRHNSITPEQFYRKDNYDRIFQKHIQWLQEEISYIQRNQSPNNNR